LRSTPASSLPAQPIRGETSRLGNGGENASLDCCETKVLGTAQQFYIERFNRSPHQKTAGPFGHGVFRLGRRFHRRTRNFLHLILLFPSTRPAHARRTFSLARMNVRHSRIKLDSRL
jgi:hypothetical protein